MRAFREIFCGIIISMEEKRFRLHSDYQPMGDQPAAIDALVEGLNEGKHEQILLGATGTGKTMLSICTGIRLCEAGVPVRFFRHLRMFFKL